MYQPQAGRRRSTLAILIGGLLLACLAGIDPISPTVADDLEAPLDGTGRALRA